MVGRNPTALNVIMHLVFFPEPVHMPKASSLICVQFPT